MQFYSLKITGRDWKLHHATGVDGIEVVLWELLTADVEGVFKRRSSITIPLRNVQYRKDLLPQCHNSH